MIPCCFTATRVPSFPSPASSRPSHPATDPAELDSANIAGDGGGTGVVADREARTSSWKFEGQLVGSERREACQRLEGYLASGYHYGCGGGHCRPQQSRQGQGLPLHAIHVQYPLGSQLALNIQQGGMQEQILRKVGWLISSMAPERQRALYPERYRPVIRFCAGQIGATRNHLVFHQKLTIVTGIDTRKLAVEVLQTSRDVIPRRVRRYRIERHLTWWP